MSDMKVSPSAWDLAAVLGLVTLLAWAPVYFAQDSTERALLDGQTFRLPAPRYGDRVEMELLVRGADGTAYASGPIITVSFERPGPDAPPDAVLVERRIFEPVNLTMGGMHVIQERSEQTYAYDATLQPVWSTRDDLATGRGLWDHEKGPDRFRFAVAGTLGLPLWPADDVPLRYERADPLRSFVHSFTHTREDGTASASVTRDMEEQYRLQAVFRSGGDLLYAGQVRSADIGPEAIELRTLYLGIHTYDVVARLDRPVPVDGGWKAWSWYMQDFPVQVGEHYQIHDASGRVLASADLVPLRLVRGDGDVVAASSHEDAARPETMRIEEWRDDQGLLAGSLSAHSIDALLRSEAAPPDVRAFMEANGRLAGIAWNGTFDRTGTPAGPTDWIVLLVDGRGDTRVIGFVTEPDGRLRPDPGLRSLCGEADHRFGVREVTASCGPVAEEGGARHNGDPIVGLSDRTIPPGEMTRLLHERATQDIQGDGPFHITAMLVPPFGHERERLGGDDGLGHILEPPVSIAHHLARYEIQSPSADRRAAIRYDDGALASQLQVDRDAPASWFATSMTARQGVPAEAPERVDVVGPTAAYAGMLLIALGLLARAMAAVTAGTHLPLFAFLYAKIHKDTALHNERRADLARLVEARPGIPLAEAARTLDLHRTVAYHHLETLCRNGLLRRLRIGRSLHYVPALLGSHEALQAAVEERVDWRPFVALVRAVPGLTGTELARRLKRHKSRVTRIGDRLVALGVLRAERNGATRRYFPREE